MKDLTWQAAIGVLMLGVLVVLLFHMLRKRIEAEKAKASCNNSESLTMLPSVTLSCLVG